MRDFAGLLTEPWMRRRAAECCLALALSPAFAWMCPFGADEQTFLARLGYWAGMLACWFVSMAIVERLFEARDVLRDAEPAFRWVAMVGTTALPMILIVGPATHALTDWEPTPFNFVELYFQIIVIGAGISMIARSALAFRHDGAAVAAARPPSSLLAFDPPGAGEEVAAEPEPRREADFGSSALVRRLPPHLRGRVIALEMEDHYVRVHTDQGSTLVLMRLSDAIAETAPGCGRQVHRSWWVADEAMRHFERAGRAGRIHLSNGLKAPVSQRYLRDVDQFVSQDGRALVSTMPDPLS